MNANPKLRKWLNHAPRPAIVTCDDARMEAPKTDRGWAELAETIETLSPSRIACVDAAGKVLRAKPFEYFFPDASDDAPKSSASDSELTVFARLLADAYDKGSKGTQPLLDNALNFIERLTQRLTKSEQEVERLRALNARLQAELAAERAAPEPEGGDDLVGGMVRGFIAAQSEGVTPIQQGKKK